MEFVKKYITDNLKEFIYQYTSKPRISLYVNHCMTQSSKLLVKKSLLIVYNLS